MPESYPPRLHKNRVTQARERVRITLFELAVQVGVTPITMRRIEEGCDVKLSVMRRIAKALNSSASWLWPERKEQ